MTRPNILFLFSDQHNAKCMSCAGHGQVQTPNLDRLSEEGVRLTNAYTVNPICTPSRISFLSGMYPSTHGYYGLYGSPPAAPLTSMFRYFKEQGYRTGALGKLHTPRYWIEQDCQYIYDEFIEHPKYLEGAGLYEKNDNRGFTGVKGGETSDLPYEHSCEAVLAKQTIRFLRNEGEPKDRGDGSAPWFAWVSFSRPHQPYTPSEPFAGMYPPDKLQLPPPHHDQNGELSHRRRSLPEAELRKLVGAYLGLISQVDYAIGTIVEELEKRGQLDNTIIVYSSDHGDYAGEQGAVEKKGGISHRAISNIPMIVRLPDASKDAPRGRTKETVVESVDLFPTLCELAGLEVPNTIQGRSFRDVLNGGTDHHRAHALTENAYRKAIATKEWRYIANLNGEERDELYHLSEDPWELINRIDDPECQEIRQELMRLLFDRVVRARKPIHTINGLWHDHKYDRDGRIDLHSCGATNPYW